MQYNYSLTTLTPVHICDGTSYTKKEYYTSKDKSNGQIVTLLNRVNLNSYVKSLSTEQQNKFLYEIQKDDFKLKSVKEYMLYSSQEEFKKLKQQKEEHPTTIDSTIKDINYNPFIPGSSIKGSIKTAIIYDYLKKEKELTTKKDYENICNNHEIDKIMSNILISDSTSAKKIKTVQPLCVTFKSKHEKSKQDDLKNSGMYNAIECISKALLDIKIQNKDDVGMDYIKECLYYFNYDYIEHELEFYSKIQNEKLINSYKKLKTHNTKKSPLIRIGGSTGLLSTTIGLHMKKNNPNLYKKTYIKEHEKFNEEFPKIRKITPQNLPFGWCRLKNKKLNG